MEKEDNEIKTIPITDLEAKKQQELHTMIMELGKSSHNQVDSKNETKVISMQNWIKNKERTKIYQSILDRE